MFCRLVSAGLTSLGRAFARHLPAVLAYATKGEDAYPPIPDPGSALHGIPPPPSSSHTPTSSSCQSSDNTGSGGRASQSGCDARASRYFSASPQSTMQSGSSGRSSGSLGRQLPVCPEGVTIQEDLELWEPAGSLNEQPSEARTIAVGQMSFTDPSASSGTGSSSSSMPSSDNTVGGDVWDWEGSGLTTGSLAASNSQLPSADAEGSAPVAVDLSSLSTSQHPPAWDDDLQSESTHTAPSTEEPGSVAPSGFAFFDSASSDPGAHSGPASKGDALKTEQAPPQTALTSETAQQTTQPVATVRSSSDDHLESPAMILEDNSVALSPQDAQLDDDTAEESDGSDDAPGAAPAGSGAPARRARAARARARAQRARAAEAQQQQGTPTVSSRCDSLPSTQWRHQLHPHVYLF